MAWTDDPLVTFQWLLDRKHASSPGISCTPCHQAVGGKVQEVNRANPKQWKGPLRPWKDSILSLSYSVPAVLCLIEVVSGYVLAKQGEECPRPGSWA
jgi:hypothetical protein